MNICIVFNHFQVQDGVGKTAIAIANALTLKPNTNVTLIPLYKYNSDLLSWLNPGVSVKPVFRGYFPGLSKLVSKLPMRLLNKILLDGKYDIQIGFCMSVPIKIVAAFREEDRNKCKRFSWMHGYDTGVSLLHEYKKIGKTVCVSQYNANRLREETGNSFDVECVYNPIDEESILSMGNEHIEIEKSKYIQLITVGRMSNEKGYTRLVKILARLKKDGYQFSLWMIGDGIEKETIEKYIKDNELVDDIHILGQKANPHAYTAKADLFVCSSYSEGYSTACTEAVILGTPVLTTNVSGGEEIICEAESGKLVEIDDESLYKGLKEVFDNPNVIQEWKSKLSQTKSRFYYLNRIKKLYDVLGV